MKTGMVVVVMATAAMVLGVLAGAQLEGEAQEYLDAHNRVRQAVGAGIPDLWWNEHLEAVSTNWAYDRASNAACDLEHSGGLYGENIFWTGGPSTPTEAVKGWAGEKESYDYDSNSCQPEKVCGHYTQIVWRDTRYLGCGSAKCPDGGKFVVCSYYPPGNYVGQKPYLQSGVNMATPEVEGSIIEQLV